MDRRKALKVTAGAFAGGGFGLLAISGLFKTKPQAVTEPFKLEFEETETAWKYAELLPSESSERAYRYYSEGSCMYATIKGILAQLEETLGEPYSSFPLHMFKYGHGGIGGYGSVCGTLNGAAAIMGLLISDKVIRDTMIADLFRWYEQEAFPIFVPSEPVYTHTPVRSISNSVLCHASNTQWCKASGYKATSNERKERCRRLTADVAGKVTLALNKLYFGDYVTGECPNNEAATCVSCHGKEGKLDNAAVQMNCNSCHSKSIGHRLFSDAHYKFMKDV